MKSKLAACLLFSIPALSTAMSKTITVTMPGVAELQQELASNPNTQGSVQSIIQNSGIVEKLAGQNLTVWSIATQVNTALDEYTSQIRFPENATCLFSQFAQLATIHMSKSPIIYVLLKNRVAAAVLDELEKEGLYTTNE